MNSSVLQKIGVMVQSTGTSQLQNPNVFGNIVLNREELEAMDLHPKMRLYEKISMREMDVEIEKNQRFCFSSIEKEVNRAFFP